ncbi:PadR family transcriptional regulator [Rhodococcus sp. 06-221-2]|uniref:PadR family transcriptional regulator n=1 Tax=Rhodococcus sp. 06-221-2 TaxID=2022514 RepID=UPI000B9C3E7D|nr:PadR family transcriptional regulator [Rhodococcus sp. 06-221-2]OZD00291.1 PadR family transcriptional regulator [Rhodococcus sp. 06-221-2]
MALEHAILVSLTELSGSGYELARRFDKSIGFFWSATHQQIYRTLTRMDGAGWITGEAVAQDGRPDKKVYSVSAAGRAELDRWIAAPTDPSQLRDELAVKIRGAANGDIEALKVEVARHRDVHATRLDVYRLIEKQDFPAPAALTGTALHQYLVLRGGIRVEEGFTEWCTEVLEKL